MENTDSNLRDVEEIIKTYGINPGDIGKVNCGYTFKDGDLIVITKDGNKHRKFADIDREVTNIKNFMWASGDILDPRILYYRFSPIDLTDEDTRARFERLNAEVKKTGRRRG